MACVTITVQQEQAEAEVPVIDFSCLRPHKKPVHESSYHELRKACEEWGGFVVVNHGIDYHIIHQMETAARAMFSLPEETKQNNRFTRKNEGYISAVPAHPFMQSFGIPYAPDPNAIEKFVDQIWPQGNPEMRKIIEVYARSVHELTHDIFKAIVTSFGVSEYYDEFEHNWGALRLNQYGLGGTLATHTDGSCITLVNQDQAGGLQVQTKGGKWINVKPVDNSFFAFSGDALKAWSNGRIHNVTHRVIMGEHHTVPRISMPYFSLFSEEKVISAPPEFVDEHHPRLYRPFVYGEYRAYSSGARVYGEYAEHSSEGRSITVQRAENAQMETAERFLEMYAGISAEQKE